MTSKLSVDTIQGVSQAGNITIQGEGTAETNLQQGLAKAWLQGTTSAGLSDSFNISGGTDVGTGEYTYAISNNMANNQWSQTCNAIAHELVQVKNITLITSAISVAVFTRADSLSVADAVNFVTLHGDLA